jgi:hypothetical protein
MTLAPCPVHGTNYRALHEHNFRGIVTVIEEIILTLSGVGTTSFSYCPVGYPWNFEGVVRALEDLNLTASGIQGGGGGAIVSGVAAGPGISIVASGGTSVVSLNSRGEGAVNLHYAGSTAVYSGLTNQVLSGSGISVQSSGTASIVNVGVLAGPNIAITYSGAFVTVSGAGGGGGGGASVTVSGAPSAGYATGDLWFDTNEGRLFVYASGAGVSSPGWYQTNAEAIALKSDTAPSGTGLNAPPGTAVSGSIRSWAACSSMTLPLVAGMRLVLNAALLTGLQLLRPVFRVLVGMTLVCLNSKFGMAVPGLTPRLLTFF